MESFLSKYNLLKKDKINDKQSRKITESRLDFPCSVSERSKDIISRLLTINPKRRLKLEDIKIHPFYRMGEKLFDLKKTKKSDKEKIKELTNIKLIEYGYNIDEVKKEIEQEKFNYITTTYFLIYYKYKGEMRKKYEKECQLEIFNTELEITLKKELENSNKKKVPLRNQNNEIEGKKTNNDFFASDDIFNNETVSKESNSLLFKTEDNLNRNFFLQNDSPFLFQSKE